MSTITFNDFGIVLIIRNQLQINSAGSFSFMDDKFKKMIKLLDTTTSYCNNRCNSNRKLHLNARLFYKYNLILLCLQCDWYSSNTLITICSYSKSQ